MAIQPALKMSLTLRDACLMVTKCKSRRPTPTLLIAQKYVTRVAPEMHNLFSEQKAFTESRVLSALYGLVCHPRCYPVKSARAGIEPVSSYSVTECRDIVSVWKSGARGSCQYQGLRHVV
jgi:hypothetical protein